MQLWTSSDNDVSASRVTTAAALSTDIETETNSNSALDQPRIIPVAAGQNALAVLLVPITLNDGVSMNGVPLEAGMHILRDRDRLECGSRTYWVSASAEVAEAAYDAGLHGDDLFCFLTKARLRAGEPIVICPGRAGAACDAKYRKAAWEMARTTNARFKCPRCGFEPGAREWQPDLPRPSRLPPLFELARKRLPETAR